LANESFVVRTVPVVPSDDKPLMHYGIVVKKKLGGAVLRNRIRRRIRAAFRLLEQSRTNTTNSMAYIVVVRHSVVAELPFSDVCNHLKGVLRFYA
jgi:ribonuclease P protein component